MKWNRPFLGKGLVVRMITHLVGWGKNHKFIIITLFILQWSIVLIHFRLLRTSWNILSFFLLPSIFILLCLGFLRVSIIIRYSSLVIFDFFFAFFLFIFSSSSSNNYFLFFFFLLFSFLLFSVFSFICFFLNVTLFWNLISKLPYAFIEIFPLIIKRYTIWVKMEKSIINHWHYCCYCWATIITNISIFFFC